MKPKILEKIKSLLVNVVDNLNDTSSNSALSANQGRILNEKIENELYYKDGDTFETKRGNYTVDGNLTGSSKSVNFVVYLDKKIDKIKTIKVNSLKAIARHANGGYAWGNTAVELSSVGTISVNIGTSYSLMFTIVFNDTISFTNNCPMSITIDSCKLTFYE